METIKYCCENFTWLISEKGRKGFSILPAKFTEKVCFVIQGRSSDWDDRTGKHIAFQQTIHFCPWCGTNLTTIVDRSVDQLSDMANKNSELIL